MQGCRASMNYWKDHKPLIDNANSRNKTLFLKWGTVTLVWWSNGNYRGQEEEYVDIASHKGKTSKIILCLDI